MVINPPCYRACITASKPSSNVSAPNGKTIALFPRGGYMPEHEVIGRAQADARQGKSPSTQAGEFVHEEIKHVREGKHGARSIQAIAIGLSKARRAGVKLPPPKAGSENEGAGSTRFSQATSPPGYRRHASDRAPRSARCGGKAPKLHRIRLSPARRAQAAPGLVVRRAAARPQRRRPARALRENGALKDCAMSRGPEVAQFSGVTKHPCCCRLSAARLVCFYAEGQFTSGQ